MTGRNHDLAARVCRANRRLPELELVTMHSGNVSGLDRAAGVLYIKPSGLDYEDMEPDRMVAIELATGDRLDSAYRPSVDLPHHLALYRELPEVGGIVHTHSNYATAFAACAREIPPILTAIADEFGGPIPCAPYTGNEDDAIGRAILGYRRAGCPAILLERHGVFAWGNDPEAALKAAAMVEDVAKTVWLALQIGNPVPMSPTELEQWFERYSTAYGQPDA